MPLYLWEGKLLTVGGALAASEDCCCGGGTPPPECGCPGIGDSLTATVDAPTCPEIDGFSWELTGPPGGSWEGTIPSPEDTFLSGKVTVRCNGDTSTAADYEILPELGTTTAECDIDPYNVWTAPDAAQCDPFRLEFGMSVVQLDPDVPCEACDESPSAFTLIITETTVRSNVRRANHVSSPMKKQGNTLLSARTKPGTFLHTFMRTHYPNKTGCFNDYRTLNSYSPEWWSSQSNLEWLGHRLVSAAVVRKISNTETAPHTITRLVNLMSRIAQVPKQHLEQ